MEVIAEAAPPRTAVRRPQEQQQTARAPQKVPRKDIPERPHHSLIGDAMQELGSKRTSSGGISAANAMASQKGVGSGRDLDIQEPGRSEDKVLPEAPKSLC
eukprot:1145378-Pelagomonas_calceolata.AAC.11